jgi:membrane-associated protein
MEFLTNLFLNLDVVLQDWVAQYGAWIYALLFLVIFMETGLVVTPFLPGDSLLFAAGALAAVGGLNLWLLYVILFAAAVLGDFLNYMIGRHWGRRILDSGRFSRVIKPKHIQATEAFFERHGGKTISLARFFPFIRTFAPFVAGISRMEVYRFVAFSMLGTAAWVGLFVTTGYLFGNIPFVAQNLEYLVIGIIALSVVPTFLHFVRSRISTYKEGRAGNNAAEPLDASRDAEKP